MAETPQAQVDVWFWSLDAAPQDRAPLSALLTDDEQARAARFFHARDRDRWIVARARMRQLLGQVVGADPADLRFETEPQGRPFLEGAPHWPSFNLSHADGVGALAVSADVRVGVDVEAIRALTDDEMTWPLSVVERNALDDAPAAERLDAFFRFWTLKEAFIKAVGSGLSLPLGDFDMNAPGSPEPRLLRLAGSPGEPARWRLAECTPAPGYRAAVAALTNGRDLVVRWHGSCLDPAH